METLDSSDQLKASDEYFKAPCPVLYLVSQQYFQAGWTFQLAVQYWELGGK